MNIYKTPSAIPSEIINNAIDVLQELTVDQMRKLEVFCSISNARYMQFGNFMSVLTVIRRVPARRGRDGLALIYERDVLGCLMTILMIQGDIDDFDKIEL